MEKEELILSNVEVNGDPLTLKNNNYMRFCNCFFFLNLKPVKCHILHADHFSSDASDLLQINIIQKDKNLTQLTGYSLQL